MSDTAAASLIIQLAVGAVMVAFGIDQLRRPQGWLHYLPPWLQQFMPLSPLSFLRSHGLGNVALGVWFLSGLALGVSLWVVLAWWVSLLPFVWHVQWSLGLRDAAIIAALVAMLWLRQ